MSVPSWLLFPAVTVLLLSAGCGGGGGGASTPTVQAPAALTYSANPATYTRGTAITANAPSSGGGAVVSYTASPALPAGLVLNPSTGVMTGTPTVVSAQATYVVTASNPGGSTTVGLVLTVTAPALPTASNITVSISGFTADEEAWIRDYHGHLVAVLNNLLGTAPVKSFNLIYDPTRHRSWGGALDNLYADAKPKADLYWASWYVVEVAHLYVPGYSGLTTDAETNLYRLNEYLSQSIASVMLYSLRSSDFMQYFSAQEIAGYGETVTLLDDPAYLAAYGSIRPEVIHSAWPNNYGMNSAAIEDACMVYAALWRADSAFYSRLFTEWNKGLWQGKAGLVATVKAACAASTVLGTPRDPWVDGTKMFSANPASLPLAIDLVTMNAGAGRGYIRHDMADRSVTGFVVIGKSDLTTLNPPGTSPWAIQPDPAFFGAVVTITIRNGTGAVVATTTAKVRPDMDNGFDPLPSLPPGSYCMEASVFLPTYNQTLTDTVCFSKSA